MERQRFNLASCLLGPYLIVAVCFACALFTGACSPKQEQRSEVSQSSPAAAPALPPADTRPVIVAFGDSLTAGVSGRSYPEQLQDLLDHSAFHYRIENQGVSGDTTTDGLARIDNVIAVHPVLLLLEFGGNDGLRGLPVASTQQNLEGMITLLQAAKIPVVLLGITLPPNYGPDYVKPFTAIFPTLAAKYKLPILPFLLLHVYQSPGMMQPDGIHPNGLGNQIVARDVFDLIRPLLTPAKP